MFKIARSKLSRGTRDWFVNTEVGVSADAYVQYLQDRGYAPSTIDSYVQGAAHFAHWLTSQSIGIGELDEQLIRSFLDRHLPTCRCAPFCRRARRSMQAALTHLLEVLRLSGRIAAKAPTRSAAINKELQGFEHYLTEVCGLAPATCYSRLRRVRAFLLDRFGAGPVSWSGVKRKDGARFIARYTAGWAVSSKRTTGSSLRSYLRFKAMSGVSTAALSAAIPKIAHWSLASVPRSLSATEITQFLGSFDRRSSTGQRDYAMARCCVDLGLRAAEIARLRLEHVNWQAGTLSIPGKGRRIDVLPLPKMTGRAIVEYLRLGRPATISRALFLRHRPPLHTPVTAGSVRHAIRNAAKRCGLKHRIDGSHVLRHTIAQRLLHSGATLKQIADLLRHRCLDTTTIYTKVDLHSLARVSLPWPGRQA